MTTETRRMMVESLNAANVEISSQKKVNAAKRRILKDFSKGNKETFEGEIGTDVMVSLLMEALYSFTAEKVTHNISYLVSKVIPMLESEVAWVRLSNKLNKDDRKYLMNFINAVNKTKAKNYKLSPNTKFNVIKLLNQFDPQKLAGSNPLKKLLAPKVWNKLAVSVSKDVAVVRPLVYRALELFVEVHPHYEVTADGHGTLFVTKTEEVGSEVKQYMFKAPLPITDIVASKFNMSRSIYVQSAEVALQSAYTFNTDYNNAIEAVIASGNHVNYFDAENDAALDAKVASVETDVKNGLAFWNELGQGNVYFNYVVDFRGRISQLGGLSAVGHKVGKAMLRAGVSKSLGTSGFKHLLIALGSSMGHDKMTLSEREAWGHDNLDTYVAVGEAVINNPVEAFKTLDTLDADDIFDAAAISLELYYISQFDGQIEDYKSNLFVGYDATCSGLQIVSLLWGNKMLAENTNVAKFDNTEDKIYDIYKYLYEAMDVVADNFDPITDATPEGEEVLAIWDNLEAKTKRAIAKKLLMPRIYGSTFQTWSGNTRKVAGKKNIFAHIEDDVEREGLIFQFGTVVANLFKATFDQEAGFQAFRDFDNVVGQVANAYNSQKMDTQWTNIEPSTFENQTVISKYKVLSTARYFVYRNGAKIRATSYNVSIFDEQVQEVSKNNSIKKDTRKAKNAISPNFVHSLDALLLHTVNYSMKTSMRLTHDCFACVAGDAERMMEVINNSYIDLFGGSNGIMQSLADETFANTGVEITIPETLNPQGINVNAIKLGTYKFS